MIAEDAADSLQLFECLSEDPFGTVHFGMEWRKGRKSREVLVRRYHAAWFDHGLLARLPDVRRNLVHLAHLKTFQGCHLSAEGSLELVWPLARGRSLAQVLRESALQGVPFGVDQALTLVWTLAHHIRKLHQAQLPLGFLTPHRIWIGFDGWVQLLDVPTIEILRDLLPKVPEARAAVASYLAGPVQEGIPHDSFQLGALLYEMLALEPLPERWDVRIPLESISVPQPDGARSPVPASLMLLLRRLLGLSEPFTDLEDLERTLEGSLFEGEFNPTTFGLAFTMQTLFRHEQEGHETGKGEEVLPAEEVKEEPPPRPPTAAPARKRKGAVWAALALVLTLGGAGAWYGLRPAPASGSASAPNPPAPAAALPSPVPPAPVAAPEPPPPPKPEPQPEPKPAPKPEPVPEPKPVRLRVFVDEQGKARQVRVLGGIDEDSELGRKAGLAAMGKVYQPVYEGGAPVRAWVEVTLMVK